MYHVTPFNDIVGTYASINHLINDITRELISLKLSLIVNVWHCCQFSLCCKTHNKIPHKLTWHSTVDIFNSFTVEQFLSLSHKCSRYAWQLCSYTRVIFPRGVRCSRVQPPYFPRHCMATFMCNSLQSRHTLSIAPCHTFHDVIQGIFQNYPMCMRSSCSYGPLFFSPVLINLIVETGV